MDREGQSGGEENKYSVAKSETLTDQETTPVETSETKTESRGLFGLGGKSDTSSSSESESEEGKERQRRRREARAARKRPTATQGTEEQTAPDYSLDSIEGGHPTGGTDYSAATALDGQQHAVGGTDYSGASVEGGHPTGGTNYSGADLGNLPESTTNTTTAAPAPEKKHHHLFGL